jgi:hypothetical protein
MFMPDQVVDYDQYGQAAMAYVQYADQDTSTNPALAFAAFHFQKGYALPDEVGANIPVALVTFNGATPLANIPYQADGVSMAIKLNNAHDYGVFAKGEVWSGSGATTSLGSTDQITQYSATLGVNLGAHLQIQSERIHGKETSGFLGAYGSGGFSTADGSKVDMNGFSVRARLGQFSAFATYRYGQASSNFSQSILTGIKADVAQDAFGIAWQDRRNAVVFAYSQPLHIKGGDLSLKLATGRTDGGTVNYATPTVVLNSGLKQTNYEIGYTRMIEQNIKIGLNVIYIKNPANSPGFDHDFGVMGMIGASF